MAKAKSKHQPTHQQPTQAQTEQAMNDIAVLFCESEKKHLSYSQIQKNFDFPISNILLEFELAGLVRQLPGQQFVLL
jgi:hypothetical protein